MAEQIWRVSTAGRVAGVVLVVGWLALALGITLGGGAPGGAVALIWWSGLLLVPWVWRWAFVPYVALKADGVFIQNRITSKFVPYPEITRVSGGYYGLTLRTSRGDVVIAWAVQKSNLARWLHRQTRADEVAQAIVARAPSALRSNPQTAR